MYSDAKECVESGGEDHPNSDMGTQDLVKECVFRVTVQDNQPPLEYSFKPDIIIAMIASVTAYVLKDVVLLNDREVMIEFEGEVPIEILDEKLSMLRKWMGILDVSLQCCWPMHGQTRIAQARRVLWEGLQTLGSPQSSSKTLTSPEVQMHILEQLVQVLREPRGEMARKQTLAFPTVLRGLPTNATVKEILRCMEQRCDPIVDAHVMLKEFNNMTQGSKESAAAYITRLEAALHRIHTKHPNEIRENRAQVMLKRGVTRALGMA